MRNAKTLLICVAPAQTSAEAPKENPLKEAYLGETYVHNAVMMDVFEKEHVSQCPVS